MNTPNTATMLEELNKSLDSISQGSVIQLGAAVVRPRRGRPPGSKNAQSTGLRGRPPASPIDQRLNDPQFIEDIQALRKKYRFRNTKELLMKARIATNTRMRFEMTDERWKKMTDLFKQGKRPREVAERMNCSVAHANFIRRQLQHGNRRAA